MTRYLITYECPICLETFVHPMSLDKLLPKDATRSYVNVKIIGNDDRLLFGGCGCGDIPVRVKKWELAKS